MWVICFQIYISERKRLNISFTKFNSRILKAMYINGIENFKSNYIDIEEAAVGERIV